jgi:hypothetical protein
MRSSQGSGVKKHSAPMPSPIVSASDCRPRYANDEPNTTSERAALAL